MLSEQMKNPSLYLSILFIILNKTMYAQCDVHIPLLIKENGKDYYLPADSLNVEKSFFLDKTYIVIIVKDCKGEMELKIYDINNKLQSQGFLINGLDTLKRQVICEDINTLNYLVQIQQYFEPLKHGDWLVFDKKKNAFKTVIYENGIPK